MSKKLPIDTKSGSFKARADKRRSTWNATAHASFADIKAAEYRFWATQPTHAAMTAVADMTTEAYALRGLRVSRLQRAPRALQ